MDLRYGISELLQQAFGINSPVYFPYPIELNFPTKPIQYDVEMSEEHDYGPTDTSEFGTKILFPISIDGGKYLVFDNDGAVVQKDFKEFLFPPVTLVDFERAKVSSKRPRRGGRTTIKHVYAFNDYVIRIRGLFLNIKGGKTAQEQKDELLKIDDIVESVNITGFEFNKRKIDNIQIDRIRTRQLAGQPGVIPFDIEAYSDETEELRL